MTTTALIFGGCCTNVFTLETIVKVEPGSGMFIFFFNHHLLLLSSRVHIYRYRYLPTYLLNEVVDYYQLESSSYQVYSADVCFHTNHEKTCLNNFSQTGLIITFLQFLFVTFFAYPSQFSSSSSSGAESSLLLQRPKVPMRRWAFIAFMFFGINMLNNWAFAYNISVPVHIILRSFGSVTTMIAGFVRGKRYSLLQVLSVVLLTVGVLISAWADSQRKVLLHLQLRLVAREDVCSVMLTTLFSFFRRARKCHTNLIPHLPTTPKVSPSSFSRNFFPHTWGHTPKTRMPDSEPAGRKTSFTPMF